jgi:hypothetical protein
MPQGLPHHRLHQAQVQGQASISHADDQLVQLLTGMGPQTANRKELGLGQQRRVPAALASKRKIATGSRGLPILLHHPLQG